MIIFIKKHCPVVNLDKLIHDLYKDAETRDVFADCSSLKYSYINDASIFSYLNGEEDFNNTHYVGKEVVVLLDGFIVASEFENFIVHTFNDEIFDRLPIEYAENNVFEYDNSSKKLKLITQQ